MQRMGLREIAKDRLTSYLNNPGRFSILIFGERGTGKSQSIKDFVEDSKTKEENFISVSCASFTDDKTAEVELFGVVDKFYTDVKGREGVFKKAKNGILFFDEIHTLTNRVQEKLMITLQTESSGKNQGKFSYSKVGEFKKEYSNARVVFASNKTVAELKEKLLPDFYDRIAQLIVEFPSLKETPDTIGEDFIDIWGVFKFEDESDCPDLKEFYKWIKIIDLSGNFRDIQKIVILWHQGRLMKLGTEEEIFDWVKGQMEKYHFENNFLKDTEYNFRKGVTKKQLEKEYRFAMYNWAKGNFTNNKEAQIALDFKRLDLLKKST